MKRVPYGISHGLRRPITAATSREQPVSGSSRHIHGNLQHAKEAKEVEVDEFGIPIKPTWSVRSLLASHPSPAVNDETLDKLHRLAALKAPERGSKEREILRGEMEGLVRLVGAVRVAEVDGERKEDGQEIVDGRIYPLPRKIDLGRMGKTEGQEKRSGGGDQLPNGRELLRHSQTATHTAILKILDFPMSSSRSQPSTSGVKPSLKERKGVEKQNSDDDNVGSQSDSAERSGSNSGSEPNEEVDEIEPIDSMKLQGGEDEENELSEQALEAYKAAQNRAGVIYISRIPPGMSPDKVRHLMSAYGDIGKVFLQQEDAKAAHLRAKHSASKTPHYTEGWVEFRSKTVARVVAAMLNAQPVGGKTGSKWKEDVWTMKYLPRFKWYMLTEQIAHEHATHAARLRMELAQSKREQRHYLKQVEIGKSLEKRKRKREKDGADGKVAVNAVAKPDGNDKDKRRRMGEKGEREAWKGHDRERDVKDVARDKRRAGDLDKVLGSIF